MYKIEIYEDQGLKVLIINNQLACFYVIRENGELCITIADDNDENFIFLESMIGDFDDFKYVKHYYVSSVNNLYDVIKEGEAIC